MTWMQTTEEEREEARQLNAVIEQVQATLPPTHTVDPAESRRQRKEGGPLLPGPVVLDSAEVRTVPGPAGDVPIRLFVPPTSRGVYLHLHGGGWVLGAFDEQDEPLQAFAEATGLTVVSVQYRLAPEHPFPAGPDDCEAAARWLVAEGATELGGGPLLIGGESAGAHLAVLTMLRLRDAGLGSPFAGANLVYGAYDLSGTPSQRRWGDRILILSTPIMAWFYDCFLPDHDHEARRDPTVSPLYADLAGLPPALLTVGDADPLLDDSLFLAARWQAAGNEVELEVYPEGMHGFNALPISIGRRCVESQVRFARSLLERVGG